MKIFLRGHDCIVPYSPHSEDLVDVVDDCLFVRSDSLAEVGIVADGEGCAKALDAIQRALDQTITLELAQHDHIVDLRPFLLDPWQDEDKD